ncbi:tetratricopeptide repeat protein, partial [Actinomadura sp. DSM 109109]|nr:tetratricopeptide repeat protein [Actinomadura lepetitiana]
VRDEGDRNTSLAASIAYSFTHLPAQDQQAITVLSLFHTITDSDVLGTMAQSPRCPPRLRDLSPQKWNEILQRATALGLLSEVGGDMFRLHPALPSYLTAHWKRLDPDGFTDEHSAAIRALLDSYASFAEWLSEQWNNENARMAVTVTDLHRRNLSAMLGHALNHQQWEHAHAIAQVLDDFWKLRGLHEEARGWVDRAQHILEDPPGTPPRLDTPAGALWALFTHNQANRHLTAGQITQAEDTYRTLLDALQHLPETDHTRASTGVLYHQFGRIAQERGKLDEAERWYRLSCEIKEQLRDRPGTAISYHQLGITAQERGKLDEAERWYRRSLAIREELRDPPGMAHSYHQLGTTAQLRGNLDEAERWYRQSLVIEEQLRYRPGTALGYHQLGVIAQLRGRLDEAERWYRKSLAIKEELGDRPGMAHSYHQLGTTTQLRGNLDEAERWYRLSLAIEEQLHHRPGTALSYLQMGLLSEVRGDFRQALQWTIRSVALFDDYPHPATGPAPQHLERLAEQLGIDVLISLWQTTTGRPLPPEIRAALVVPDEGGPDESGNR